MAEALRDELRKTDIPARYGGEEFALIMTDTTKDDAVKLIQRKKDSISNYVTDRLRGENRKFAESGRVITLSVGIYLNNGGIFESTRNIISPIIAPMAFIIQKRIVT